MFESTKTKFTLSTHIRCSDWDPKNEFSNLRLNLFNLEIAIGEKGIWSHPNNTVGSPTLVQDAIAIAVASRLLLDKYKQAHLYL